MSYPSAELSAAMQQQMVAVNSAEVALGNTIFRVIEACKSAAEAAQRIYEVIDPVNRGVDAISASVGHDQFNYWIDTATFTHLTNSTDAMQAALDNAETELLEAKQQFLRLDTLTQSSLPAHDRIRVVNLLETARVAIRELWDQTKMQQEDINAIQAILSHAEMAVWL